MEFEFYQQLVKSSSFQSWMINNKDVYLAHFYCTINNNMELGPWWEVGYYHPKTDKLTIFTVGSEINIKPEEDVFKEESKIDELGLKDVKIDIMTAMTKFKEVKEQKYPREILNSGFLILQSFHGQTFWNLSYATSSFHFLNVKINAVNGQIISYKLINFIEQIQKGAKKP